MRSRTFFLILFFFSTSRFSYSSDVLSPPGFSIQSGVLIKPLTDEQLSLVESIVKKYPVEAFTYDESNPVHAQIAFDLANSYKIYSRQNDEQSFTVKYVINSSVTDCFTVAGRKDITFLDGRSYVIFQLSASDMNLLRSILTVHIPLREHMLGLRVNTIVFDQATQPYPVKLQVVNDDALEIHSVTASLPRLDTALLIKETEATFWKKKELDQFFKILSRCSVSYRLAENEDLTLHESSIGRVYLSYEEDLYQLQFLLNHDKNEAILCNYGIYYESLSGEKDNSILRVISYDLSEDVEYMNKLLNGGD